MNYRDCIPIRSRPCSAWELELSDGVKKIILCAPEMSFEEVHAIYKNRLKQFKLSQVVVGEFTVVLEKGDQSYKADSRAFNQDLECS